MSFQDFDDQVDKILLIDLQDVPDIDLHENEADFHQDSNTAMSAELERAWKEMCLDFDEEEPEELPRVATVTTPTKTIFDMLDAYSKSPNIQKGVLEAQKIEAKATSIDCFTLKPEFNNPKLNEYFKINQPSIKAVIDWLEIEMVVNQFYNFKHPNQAFSDIRKFLKDNGINENAYVVQSKQNIYQFSFTIHDVESGKSFDNVLHLLRCEYSPISLKITRIELALDFWNMKSDPFLLALSKSLRVNQSVSDDAFRAYRSNQKNGFMKMPSSPLIAIKHINNRYTIGIGHRSEGDFYVRLYLKRRDQKKVLPSDQHRIRIEVNLRGDKLTSLNNDVSNLRHLITNGFKSLQFTKLSDKATEAEVKTYHSKIRLFGRETLIISKSRNKRDLPEFIKSHAELNRAVGKAVANLTRKF